MNRTLLTAFAFWVLLLSPGLCLAGAIEHLCADCPEQAACSHEDDCENDPCVEVLPPPAMGKVLFASGDLPACLHGAMVPGPGPGTTAPVSLHLILPTRDNLPLPPSALPLLS
jgi:hypothetical protein